MLSFLFVKKHVMIVQKIIKINDIYQLLVTIEDLTDEK